MRVLRHSAPAGRVAPRQTRVSHVGRKRPRGASSAAPGAHTRRERPCRAAGTLSTERSTCPRERAHPRATRAHRPRRERTRRQPNSSGSSRRDRRARWSRRPARRRPRGMSSPCPRRRRPTTTVAKETPSPVALPSDLWRHLHLHLGTRPLRPAIALPPSPRPLHACVHVAGPQAGRRRCLRSRQRALPLPAAGCWRAGGAGDARRPSRGGPRRHVWVGERAAAARPPARPPARPHILPPSPTLRGPASGTRATGAATTRAAASTLATPTRAHVRAAEAGDRAAGRVWAAAGWCGRRAAARCWRAGARGRRPGCRAVCRAGHILVGWPGLPWLARVSRLRRALLCGAADRRCRGSGARVLIERGGG